MRSSHTKNAFVIRSSCVRRGRISQCALAAKVQHGNFRSTSQTCPDNLATRRPAPPRNAHIRVVVALSVLLLVGLAGLSVYLVTRPANLRIAVGPPGSNDVRFLQAAAQTFARARDHIRLSLTTTAREERNSVATQVRFRARPPDGGCPLCDVARLAFCI